MATVPESYQQESPNQQSLILECSVCAEQYGPDFNNVPRSLRCGHTFCTSCLMKILSSRGVPCPMCSRLHPLTNPDVMLLPINYAVQDIMKNISSREQNSILKQVATCGVCNLQPATVVCVDCDPGKHFNFCTKCDQEEHTRPFGPAQRHKRFDIDKVPTVPSTYIHCPRHLRVTALFYSESTNEFACNMCHMEEDWPSRSSQFEHINEITKRMRVKVQRWTKYTNDMTKQLSDSKQMLETILNSLEPGSMAVKANITKTFSQCIEILQERQRKLLDNVELELKNRSESLKKQHAMIVRTNAKYRDAFESLNSLVSKSDTDFLSLYQTSIPGIESLISQEDKSLLRPLVSQDIPFFISKDIEKQLRTLGAVGGGLTPIELECSPKGSRGTLLEILWQLPEGCGRLNRFQVEYEQILDDSSVRRGSGPVDMVSEAGDLSYVQSEPQFYEVPGNELNAYVDYLCPGYSYRFRIRSANDAGFGMWSDPIVGNCTDFPYTLEYTKRIHRIIIPVSGYYRITVKGASAADGMVCRGGRGAIISATFSLKAGNVLIMLVGGMSSKQHYHSGGGGGSYVALNEINLDSLLIAAGGGGGTRGADANDFDGLDANIYEDGFDGLGEDCGKGGKSGSPGEDARDSKKYDGLSWGCGGAGFIQDSTTALSFLAGGHAGQNGGFGGGGAVGMYGGGGGGGYSGGGGGRGGGGGGSYVITTATEVSREVGNVGHGSIFIETVVPPYPISNSFLNRTVSTSTSEGSTTQLAEKMSTLESTASSTSVSTKANIGSVNGSTGFNTIHETDSESIHQSPASTSQVMDQMDEMSAAMFTIEDDDLDIDPLVYNHEQTNATLVLQQGGGVGGGGVALPRYNTGASTEPTGPLTAAPAPVVVNEVFTIAPSNLLGTGNPATFPGGDHLIDFSGGEVTFGLVDTFSTRKVKDTISAFQEISTAEAVRTCEGQLMTPDPNVAKLVELQRQLETIKLQASQGGAVQTSQQLESPQLTHQQLLLQVQQLIDKLQHQQQQQVVGVPQPTVRQNVSPPLAQRQLVQQPTNVSPPQTQHQAEQQQQQQQGGGVGVQSVSRQTLSPPVTQQQPLIQGQGSQSVMVDIRPHISPPNTQQQQQMLTQPMDLSTNITTTNAQNW